MVVRHLFDSLYFSVNICCLAQFPRHETKHGFLSSVDANVMVFFEELVHSKIFQYNSVGSPSGLTYAFYNPVVQYPLLYFVFTAGYLLWRIKHKEKHCLPISSDRMRPPIAAWDKAREWGHFSSLKRYKLYAVLAL